VTSQVNTTEATRNDKRRWPRRLAIAAAVLYVIGIAGAIFIQSQLDLGAAVAGATEVAVVDDRFEPAVIEVPTGTEITWRWQGQNEHNVVGEGFESPVQTEGTFVTTFRDPGTFDYRCTLHPFMRGQVMVTAEAVASPTSR
jgi:plastocyanin